VNSPLANEPNTTASSESIRRSAAELIALRLSTGTCCGEMAPVRPESLLQLRQVRSRHFHRGCYHRALL
jgi:hypothetical protein